MKNLKEVKKTINDVLQPIERRAADYSLLEITKKFKHGKRTECEGTYGNISMDLYPHDSVGSYYTHVSAPMLLARLIAAGFTPDVHGQDGYKTTWTFILKHKKTGCIATFYDWKGGVSFGACDQGHKNEEFKADLKLLTEALINPCFPHPYDGCVVGEIA